MLSKRLGVLLGFALALSLAVNLFLIGDYAGRRFFQAPPVQMGTVGGRLATMTRYQRLPPADRAHFRAVMVGQGAVLRDAQRGVRAAQDSVLAAMRMDPYDKERVLDAFATLRAATTARQAAYQAALASAVATLPAKDRDTLAGPVPVEQQ